MPKTDDHTATDLPPLAHVVLRAATGGAHDKVDAAFSTCDFADATSYAAFLTAHARVLPPIEAVLRDQPGLPPCEPRAPALAADLAALGLPMPVPDTVPPPASNAEAWGMLYVIEGSRLGGVMLARQVPETLPRNYLAAAHPRGGWRALLAALDEAGRAGGASWLAEAIAAAERTFDLYGAVAENTTGVPVTRSPIGAPAAAGAQSLPNSHLRP